MQNEYRYAFLGYKMLSDIARKVLQNPEFAAQRTLVVDAQPENISAAVDQCLSKGCEIFIAGSSNAAEFRRRFKLPLIEISLQEIDYVTAIKRALSLGERPIIAYYRHSHQPNMSKFEYLFDTRIPCITYEDAEDLRGRIEVSDADVVIGTSLVLDIAQSLGREGVLLYAGEQTIADALRRAQLKFRRMEKTLRHNEFMNSILRSTTNGIIGLTPDNEVFIYNHAAEEILGASYARVRSRDAAGPLAELGFTDTPPFGVQIRTIHEKLVQITVTPVEEAGRALGTLVLLNVVTDNTDSKGLLRAKQEQHKSFNTIHGSSYSITQAISEAKARALNDSHLLITGETGTGKHLFAHCIAGDASSTDDNIRLINCAAVHEVFAAPFFFGAPDTEQRPGTPGLLDICTGGTLVLDNLWEASPAVQSCLHSIVQGSFIQGVDGAPKRSLRMRIISIVPTQYMDMLKKNLRKDLYYQLAAYHLRIPALRERQEDAVELFNAFVMDNRSNNFDRSFSLSASLRPILLTYTWPGNVQELLNVSKRFSAALSGQVSPSVSIQRRALIEAIGEDELFTETVDTSGIAPDKLSRYPDKLAEIVNILNGTFLMSNEMIAAKLGISRTTLWRLLKA